MTAIKVEFSGGLEKYFGEQKTIDLEFTGVNLKDLIEQLRANHMTDSEEMFVQAGTVRPGILVLINDTDWELLDQIEYVVQPRDVIAFISTLHGG